MARSRRSVDELVGAALAASGARAHAAPDRPVAVAYSGGLDSGVLLHGAVRALGAERVVALHVHHGLQPAADDWAIRCGRWCAALGVAMRTLHAAGAPGRGDSVEQWARAERYRLLLDAARAAGSPALLTAHHADDQLETVLLALARGCGLDGLTGIAARDVRAGVTLLRPLLALDRAALEADAHARGLDWVVDPSNADAAHPRNAVRLRVLPAIRDALPGLPAQLADTLALLAQSRSALDALAREDLEAARCDTTSGTVVQALDRRRLATLPPERCANALRMWLASRGAPPPHRAALAQMRRQLVDGDAAYGDVAIGRWRLLRHRDRIVAMGRGAMPAALAPEVVRWHGESRIPLASGGSLRFERDERGVGADWLARQRIDVDAARGGERLRPKAGGPSRTIRNLWQEAGVPAWLRRTLPALRVDGRLLAAVPFGMDRGDDWPRDGERVVVGWTPDDAHDPRGSLAPGRGDGAASL